MDPRKSRRAFHAIRFAAVLILAPAPAFCLAQTESAEDIEIIGDGAAAVSKDLAAAEEDAVWDAKRNAVERAAGIFLRARAIGRDFQLEDDQIEATTNGFIKKWALIPESRKVELLEGGRVLRLQIKATVALLPVIRKLADIQDVYDDLERPRIRIRIAHDSARRAEDTLTAALKAEGFEIVRDDKAEIVIAGILTYAPTLKLGDRQTPYGVGGTLAACRARLAIQVVSEASEAILLTAEGQGSGRSFTSDSEARSDSAESAADDLVIQSRSALRENLIVRWARERQEGHVVAIRVSGLAEKNRVEIRQQLGAMRGFRRIISEKNEQGAHTFRILTRLNTASIRRRLNTFALTNRSITVLDKRGPLITCAARSQNRLTVR